MKVTHCSGVIKHESESADHTAGHDDDSDGDETESDGAYEILENS